jgi:alpha-1,2-mannosyltransferase
MNWRGGLKTSQGIFWFAMAGILGWPFASALCAPYILEELVLMVFSDSTAKLESGIRIGRGIVAAVLILVRRICVMGLSLTA